MRGVFLMVFLLFIFPINAFASGVHGEIISVLETGGASLELDLDSSKDLSFCTLKWGINTKLSLGQTQQIVASTFWELVCPTKANIQMICSHNTNHFTSNEEFRLINKNNFTVDSYFYSLQSDQFKFGFLRGIPFKNKDLVDAIFVESVFRIGDLALTGLGLRYAGTANCGTAKILQANYQIGSVEMLAATGWQTDLKGDEHRGKFFELRRKGVKFSGNLIIQDIDPGFISPLAKLNKYTPDRQGWQLDLASNLGAVDLELKLRRHENYNQTKEYNQLVWQVSSASRNTSFEWRIQPTPAFIIRYKTDDLLFQFDPINYTWRNDLTIGETNFSFRLDALRQIARLECRCVKNLEWHLIGKYDLLKKRFHYFIDIQKKLKNNIITLTIGEYDKGNLASGFNNPASFSISWTQKF